MKLGQPETDPATRKLGLTWYFARTSPGRRWLCRRPLAPGFDDARHAADGSRRAGIGVKFLDDAVDFGPRREIFRDYGISDVFHRERAHQFDLAIQACRLGDTHLNVFETGGGKDCWHARTDVWVSAAAFHCFGVQRDVAGKCGTLRIAEISTEVDVSDDQGAAGTQSLADFSDEGTGIRQVGQKESGVNKIKFRRGLGCAEIAGAKFEVRKIQRCRFFPRDGNLDVVNVHSDDCSTRANQARKFAGDVASAAADIETRHAGTNARSMKEIERRGPHDARENPEASSSFNAAADNVMRLVKALAGS